MGTEPTVAGKLGSPQSDGCVHCNASVLLSSSHKIIQMQPLCSSCLGQCDGELCSRGCSQRFSCQRWRPAQSSCSQRRPLPHGDPRGKLPDTAGPNPGWGSCFQLRLSPWPCLCCSSPHPTALCLAMGPAEPPPPAGWCPSLAYPYPQGSPHTWRWGCPWLPPTFCPDLDTVFYFKLGSSWNNLLAVLKNKMESVHIFAAIWQIYYKSLWFPICY